MVVIIPGHHIARNILRNKRASNRRRQPDSFQRRMHIERQTRHYNRRIHTQPNSVVGRKNNRQPLGLPNSGQNVNPIRHLRQHCIHIVAAPPHVQTRQNLGQISNRSAHGLIIVDVSEASQRQTALVLYTVRYCRTERQT